MRYLIKQDSTGKHATSRQKKKQKRRGNWRSGRPKRLRRMLVLKLHNKQSRQRRHRHHLSPVKNEYDRIHPLSKMEHPPLAGARQSRTAETTRCRILLHKLSNSFLTSRMFDAYFILYLACLGAIGDTELNCNCDIRKHIIR